MFLFRTALQVRGAGMVISVDDIGWLRLAVRTIASDAIPSRIAARLLRARLIEVDLRKRALKITKRGELALLRLG
jgi:hypothetical protein